MLLMKKKRCLRTALELFPNPSDKKLWFERHDFIDCLKPALSENNFMKIAATPDGFILVTLHDWPSLLTFKSEYLAGTCTDYYSNQTRFSGEKVTKRFFCR